MKKEIDGQKGLTLGELVVVMAIVLVVVLALQPLMADMRRRMEKAVCANNIRELGKALFIYAKEHEGKFPASLKTLYAEQYIADPKLVDCPSSKQKGSPDDPDYAYASGLSVRDPSGTPLISDKDENHKKGKNVLTVNGTVFWVRKTGQ